MKTKLEMAHEWYLKCLEVHESASVHGAWQYADTMQAEADKREKLKQDRKNCHHDLVSIGLEEWKLDWSQAPSGYDWFVVGGCSGKGFFCAIKPQIVKDHYWFVGDDCFSVDSHGYQGDWRNSLRERPQ